MKFGYFANVNNRHLEKPFSQVMEETRDIARVCDQARWHSIWLTEHHFGHEGDDRALSAWREAGFSSTQHEVLSRLVR